MKESSIDQFRFEGLPGEKIDDLNRLSPEDKQQLLMAGVDVEAEKRSGTFMHLDHSGVYCKATQPGVEILDITDALHSYDGLTEYFWRAADPAQDIYTQKAHDTLQGGYFVRVTAGAQPADPVQSCLFMKAERVGQSVHNVVVVEEEAELHIITGCAVSRHSLRGMHIGISEFYVKKGGRLTFTMVHNWGEEVIVRPRSVGIVEEGGVFLNNYILIRPVRDLQMYPTVKLNGRGAVARFNSILVAPPGSHIDAGSRIELNAPETRAEIVSRAISTGGTIIARGCLEGRTRPARGHLECKGLILGDGCIHAIPELTGTVPGVELSHEAAVGKIAQEEIEYLMARGLDEEEATATIVRGFLNVDIMGLPERLKEAVDHTIDEFQRDMF